MPNQARTKNMKIREKVGRNVIGVIIAYFLIYVVWGSTYFFIGVALKDFPPFLLGALRFTAAGLILLAICRVRGEKIFKKRLIRRSAVSGIVLLFIDMAVVMLAQRYVTSSFVAIIASSTALWIMLLDVPMWKSNFCSFFKIAGAVVGFAGVVMLYIEQLGSEWLSPHSERGFLLLIVGCISWATGTLYAKYRSSREEEVNAFAGSAWQMLFASAMFWLCTLINGDISGVQFSQVSAGSWLSLLYLITFGSLLAYSAYVWLLKVRPAAEVGTHAYVNPFIAVLLGVFLGGEHVSIAQILGLILILLGVMLISKKRRRV